MQNDESYRGLRVTVMGLGLHGGGIASARYLASRGARVTVTDLRDAATLAPSIRQLKGLPIRYVLGRHEETDFRDADMVVKNPAVPGDSPYLAVARRIETDITLFLAQTGNPIIAVTGSKGKSSTVSAIHHVLRTERPGARLGGNITVSPLTFLDALDPSAPVVLELSSWQLADLAGRSGFRPRIAMITNILPDHQNRYAGMREYVADKKVIYRNQTPSEFTIFSADDPYGREFSDETRGRVLLFSSSPLQEHQEGAWLERGKGFLRVDGNAEEILPETILLPGEHHRMNLLAAALALRAFGVAAQPIRRGLALFRGVEHRLELFAEKRGVRFYNDSAATIPEATAAAIRSFDRPQHLIFGGTDKELDFGVLDPAIRKPRGLYLLAGSASVKIADLLRRIGAPYHGPYDSLRVAVEAAYREAEPGSVIVLSPGCASFEMFLNEFDRGDRFREIVRSLPD